MAQSFANDLGRYSHIFGDGGPGMADGISGKILFYSGIHGNGLEVAVHPSSEGLVFFIMFCAAIIICREQVIVLCLAHGVITQNF